MSQKSVCGRCGSKIMPVVRDDDGKKCPMCGAPSELLEEVDDI